MSAMRIWKITYNDTKVEEVEAETYDVDGGWFSFSTSTGSGAGTPVTVLRIREGGVKRVELIEEHD
jgi:hypothetical protein